MRLELSWDGSGTPPCSRTKAKEVFSAKTVRASPDGFLSLMSPSFSVRWPMAMAMQDLEKVGDFSARRHIML